MGEGYEPANWERLEELFESASALPVRERPAFLAVACAGDDSTRGELEALLACTPAAERFFGRMGGVLQAAAAEPPPALEDALVGTRIGRYHVEGRLGAGGMGIVYRAYDTHLQRVVALKLLPAEVCADEHARTRFLTEARAAAALDHPNICTIHETAEADSGQPILVMAYCDGETLKAKIARGPLTIDEVLRFATQMARALAAAHARGIVHRDVKPGNVIITEDGLLKLLDFGVARMPDVTHTAPGLARGTVAYMAPEQLRGEPSDAQADLWAFGVTLYEMVTGTRPFRGDSEGTLLYAILNEQPEPPAQLRPDLPAGLCRIIDRLLRKDPAERYRDIRDVLDDLEGAPPSRSPHNLQRTAFAAGFIAVAVVLLRLFGAQDSTRGVATNARPDGVAVLFFQDHTRGELDWLADGLTRSLISTLRTVPVLRVRPTNSVWPYRDGLTAYPIVAGNLEAKWLVDGNVRLERDQIVTTAELVDGATGNPIDSFQITRPSGQALDLVEDVVNEVTTKLEALLRRRIGQEIRIQHWQSEGNDAAFRYVHRASLMAAEKDSLIDAGHVLQAWQSLRAADAVLARAEREDTAWAEPSIQRAWLAENIAFLALGISLNLDARTAANRDSAALALRRGVEFANRAIALDPNNPRALEIRGILHHALTLLVPADSANNVQRLKDAETDLRAAISFDPNLAQALNRLSSMYFLRGDFEEAVQLAERAWAADSYLDEAQEILARLFTIDFEAGNDDRAARWCNTIGARFPASRESYRCALTLMAWSDSVQDPDSAWRLSDLGTLAATPSDRSYSQAQFETLVAGVLTRSDPDSAIAVLERTHAQARRSSLFSDEVRGAALLRWQASVWLRLPDHAAEACEMLQQSAGRDRAFVLRSRRFKDIPRDCLTPAAPTPD